MVVGQFTVQVLSVVARTFKGASVDHPLSITNQQQYTSFDVNRSQFGWGGRALTQDIGDSVPAAAQEDLFADVGVCEGLADILHAAPDTLDHLGNFTEEPSLDILLECTSQHSLQAVRALTPEVKVLTLDTSAPTVLPSNPPTSVPNGTIVVVDCQNSWLDLRLLPDVPSQQATMVMLRCSVLLGDRVPYTWQTWTFDSSLHYPCNAMGALATSGGFPRSNPGMVEEADTAYRTFIVHSRNQTKWCWRPSDIRSIFLGPAADSNALGPNTAASGPSSSSALPVWSRWAIVLRLVWVYRRDCYSAMDRHRKMHDTHASLHATEAQSEEEQRSAEIAAPYVANTAPAEHTDNSPIPAVVHGTQTRKSKSSVSSSIHQDRSKWGKRKPPMHQGSPSTESADSSRHTTSRLTSTSLPSVGFRGIAPGKINPDTVAWVEQSTNEGSLEQSSNSIASSALTISQARQQRSRLTQSLADTSTSACNTETSVISKGNTNTASVSISFGLRAEKTHFESQTVTSRQETGSITAGLRNDKSNSGSAMRADKSFVSSVSAGTRNLPDRAIRLTPHVWQPHLSPQPAIDRDPFLEQIDRLEPDSSVCADLQGPSFAGASNGDSGGTIQLCGPEPPFRGEGSEGMESDSPSGSGSGSGGGSEEVESNTSACEDSWASPSMVPGPVTPFSSAPPNSRMLEGFLAGPPVLPRPLAPSSAPALPAGSPRMHSMLVPVPASVPPRLGGDDTQAHVADGRACAMSWMINRAWSVDEWADATDDESDSEEECRDEPTEDLSIADLGVDADKQ